MEQAAAKAMAQMEGTTAMRMRARPGKCERGVHSLHGMPSRLLVLGIANLQQTVLQRMVWTIARSMLLVAAGRRGKQRCSAREHTRPSSLQHIPRTLKTLSTQTNRTAMLRL